MQALRIKLQKDKGLLSKLALVSGLLYLLFYLVAPLRNYFKDTGLFIKDIRLIVFVLVIYSALILIYLLVINYVDFGKESFKKLFLIVVAINAGLLFILPVASDDLYTYIQRGRVMSVYRQNPYTVSYSNFNSDLLAKDISTAWSGNTEIYPPVMLYINGLLTLVAGDSLLLNITFFKGLFIALNILSGLLIWKITKDKKAFILYSFNPIVIFEFAINSHNDIVMVFFFLTGLYFLLRKKMSRTLIGVALFTVSFLAKQFTLILMPFVFLYLFRREGKLISKLVRISLAAGIVFGIAVITYLPFWQGTVIFKRFSELLTYGVNASSIGVLLVSLTLILLTSKFGYFANLLNKLIFAASYIYLFAKAFLKKDFIENSGFVKFLMYAVFVFFSTFFIRFFPWYYSLLIALIAVYTGLIKKFDQRFILYSTLTYSVIIYCLLL